MCFEIREIALYPEEAASNRAKHPQVSLHPPENGVDQPLPGARA
jgi:hypothetical protein